ncbi:MAG: hypothetical protein AB7F99_12640 [Vicinamibacterales bacterium]
MTPATAFLRRAARFTAIGLVLYAGLYAAAEGLVYRHADRNRFFAVRTAPRVPFDAVILGASHAAVFDYRDMNAQLEKLAGARIMNLAEVGSGIAMNRLLLDYFLEHHSTNAVVYILDSFAFYSAEWNEVRLRDSSLFLRAPFDPALARLLLSAPASRSTGLDYVSGFSKINNPDRFEPDLFPDEGARFDRAYRPIAQIDRQRLAYLYPENPDPSMVDRYAADFEALAREVRERGMRFLVIRPPIPARVREQLPDEDRFDAALRTRLEPYGVEWHDFSQVANDEALFYDTDHLNREGVMNFCTSYLAPVLRSASGQ